MYRFHRDLQNDSFHPCTKKKNEEQELRGRKTKVEMKNQLRIVQKNDQILRVQKS